MPFVWDETRRENQDMLAPCPRHLAVTYLYRESISSNRGNRVCQVKFADNVRLSIV